MTLENATGGPGYPGGWSPHWSADSADCWPPRSTDDCRLPKNTGDYTTPPNTDYMYQVQLGCRQKNIEGKLDRIIALLEQLVKNL